MSSFQKNVKQNLDKFLLARNKMFAMSVVKMFKVLQTHIPKKLGKLCMVLFISCHAFLLAHFLVWKWHYRNLYNTMPKAAACGLNLNGNLAMESVSNVGVPSLKLT